MIYDFAETNSHCIIFVYKKTARDVEIKPELEDARRLRISSEVTIELYRDVHPAIEVRESGSRVEVHLRKVESVKWGGVHGKDPSTSPTRKLEATGDDEEEPLSAIDLLSKIYQKSGDDVRRAMEKSFYESEGTVLSTDWDRVKSRKVDREE